MLSSRLSHARRGDVAAAASLSVSFSNEPTSSVRPRLTMIYVGALLVNILILDIGSRLFTTIIPCSCGELPKREQRSPVARIERSEIRISFAPWFDTGAQPLVRHGRA